eukprot:4193110-Prorocentrum_lima.AAC.1
MPLQSPRREESGKRAKTLFGDQTLDRGEARLSVNVKVGDSCRSKQGPSRAAVAEGANDDMLKLR